MTIPSTQLFQVQVFQRDKGNAPLLVGPALSEARALDGFVMAINKAVADGKERNWADAHIVSIQTKRTPLQ